MIIVENDSIGITDPYPGCGQPQMTYLAPKITSVKDLAIIFCSMSLTHQDFISCQTIL